MELHNLGTYVLPQNIINFLLGALPRIKNISRALGPVWQAEPVTNASQSSPGIPSTLSPSTEAILLVRLRAPVEALCGCENTVREGNRGLSAARAGQVPEGDGGASPRKV